MASKRAKRLTAKVDKLPIRFHPRALKTLGADLVTDDVVALMELVKNSYDAFATTVDVTFGVDKRGTPVLDVQDDGSGMSREIIEQAWCVVATPYRVENRVARRGKQPNRRVAGEKGVGRLSAARLGSELEMITATRAGPCWKVEADWDHLAAATDLKKLFVTCEKIDKPAWLKRSGTRIRVRGLRSKWLPDLPDEEPTKLEDLRSNLSRMMQPFGPAPDFQIRLKAPGVTDSDIEVEPPAFLKYPKYTIQGRADANGEISYRYRFQDLRGRGRRSKREKLSWKQVQVESRSDELKAMKAPGCGPFAFEIRAWDIAPNDTQEIADRFELKKSTIRADIRAHKGISIYRDDILVLPKSEGTRDWLGLDARRIGRVGPRLSTPQVVGYVAITADGNPHIGDTSDREGLAAAPEVTAFQAMLFSVVGVLENERDKDRRGPEQERKSVDLFAELDARGLVGAVTHLAKHGGSAQEAVPLVEDFSDKLDGARKAIEERFIYYSRLATIGTISQMLVHEVRNRTTIIGSALATVREVLEAMEVEKRVERRVELGVEAVEALERLAETFAPLANRSFRRKRRSCTVEESAIRCMSMLAADLKSKKIQIEIPHQSLTEVAVDPGELDAIFLNLFANAVYWLGFLKEGERRIAVCRRRLPGGRRVQVEVHDSGSGIPESEEERIFWPGVTSKSGGIGMGLTVASELVAEHGGQMALVKPGELRGATFVFDLPLKKKK